MIYFGGYLVTLAASLVTILGGLGLLDDVLALIRGR